MDWVLMSSAAFADGISTKDSAQMTATNDAKSFCREIDF